MMPATMTPPGTGLGIDAFGSTFGALSGQVASVYDMIFEQRKKREKELRKQTEEASARTAKAAEPPAPLDPGIGNDFVATPADQLPGTDVSRASAVVSTPTGYDELLKKVGRGAQQSGLIQMENGLATAYSDAPQLSRQASIYNSVADLPPEVGQALAARAMQFPDGVVNEQGVTDPSLLFTDPNVTAAIAGAAGADSAGLMDMANHILPQSMAAQQRAIGDVQAADIAGKANVDAARVRARGMVDAALASAGAKGQQGLRTHIQILPAGEDKAKGRITQGEVVPADIADALAKAGVTSPLYDPDFGAMNRKDLADKIAGGISDAKTRQQALSTLLLTSANLDEAGLKELRDDLNDSYSKVGTPAGRQSIMDALEFIKQISLKRKAVESPAAAYGIGALDNLPDAPDYEGP